ncbi:MAG: hypothetical protein KY446_04080, partial [Proteobacteria bacterium]|nr:hypothetical protein [Pseudomonadota bacterium]
GGFGSFLAREWRLERQELVERRTTITSVMAANSATPLTFGDKAIAQQVLRSARGVPDVEAVILFDSAGRPFARYGTGEAAPAARTVAPGWKFRHGSLEVRVPVRMDGDPVG